MLFTNAWTRDVQQQDLFKKHATVYVRTHNMTSTQLTLMPAYLRLTMPRELYEP